MTSPDPFAAQAAGDPFAAPGGPAGDPFSAPPKGGGEASAPTSALFGRLFAVKYLRTTQETSNFAKPGDPQVDVVHVNLAVLDGGPIIVTKQDQNPETYAITQTQVELGNVPLVFPDYWFWNASLQSDVGRTGMTLGRLVRSPNKAAKKQFPDRAALEAFHLANPAMIEDKRGPGWFWKLAEPTPADRAIAMAWWNALDDEAKRAFNS